jgi:hypothetical protein
MAGRARYHQFGVSGSFGAGRTSPQSGRRLARWVSRGRKLEVWRRWGSVSRSGKTRRKKRTRSLDAIFSEITEVVFLMFDDKLPAGSSLFPRCPRSASIKHANTYREASHIQHCSFSNVSCTKLAIDTITSSASQSLALA